MSAILENVGHVENISRIGNNCFTCQIARLLPAISRWKQMQCQIKVLKCNVGGHFENMAAIFEFDGILGGQHFLFDKEGKMYVHTKFHACITICTILVLSRSTRDEIPNNKLLSK